MEDFVKNIKAQLYDRVSSPLSFSFIVSWALWNYRYLIIVFSSMDPDKKFSAIDSLSAAYTSSWVYWLQFGILFPLLTTFFYIFVYPRPAKFVFRYARETQRELKTIQTSIDDETPLSMEESRALKRQVREIVKEYDAEISEKDELIGRLRQQSQRSPPEVLYTETVTDEVLPPEVNAGIPPAWPAANRASELSSSQLSILRKIAEAPFSVAAGSLVPASGSERLKAEYDIDKLSELNYIKYVVHAGQAGYKITPKGRAFIIENA